MQNSQSQQVLNLQVTDGLTVAVIQDSSYEFLMPTKDVIIGFGVSEYNIRQHKSTNPDEFIEGKHFAKGVSISHTLCNAPPVNFQLQNSIPKVDPAFRKPKFHKYIVGRG